jgi:predicted ATPase
LRETEISLGRITVLAGLNSTGKSSVIQGLLLLRSFAEYLHERKEIGDLVSSFPLNGSYLLSLGSASDVITRNSGKEFELKIKTSENESNCKFFTDKSLEEDVYHVSVVYDKWFTDSYISSVPFYYLNAERLGPRIAYSVNESSSQLNCGFRGEYTVEVLARTRSGAIEVDIVKEKWLDDKAIEGFSSLPRHVSEWMEFITPGTEIGVAKILGRMRSSEIAMNGFTPPNVGFGISYVLPIVVTGLLAEKESIMIVENPEAHLHPLGQSNIGYFLAKIAASGVQVIVETHSEHVVNGIRNASLSLTGITNQDVNLHFFRKNEDGGLVVRDIEIDLSGDFSSFPRDFFDQVQQDMAKLYKSVRKNG